MGPSRRFKGTILWFVFSKKIVFSNRFFPKILLGGGSYGGGGYGGGYGGSAPGGGSMFFFSM